MFNNKDPLLGLFLFESKQNIEKVEVILIECEKSKAFDFEAINEIFRNMHSLKSSAALMDFENISDASHAVEDLFFYIREKNPVLDFQKVGDIVLFAIDFIKNEITKIEANEPLSDTNKEIRTLIEEYLRELKSVSHYTIAMLLHECIGFESLSDITHQYSNIKPSIYQRTVSNID